MTLCTTVAEKGHSKEYVSKPSISKTDISKIDVSKIGTDFQIPGLNCACVIVTSCKCCAIATRGARMKHSFIVVCVYYIIATRVILTYVRTYVRTLIAHVHFSDPIIYYIYYRSIAMSAILEIMIFGNIDFGNVNFGNRRFRNILFGMALLGRRTLEWPFSATVV